MKKQQIWQGGVCEGLEVDSLEASERLRAVYGYSIDLEWRGIQDNRKGEEPREPTLEERREWEEENLDFFEWIMRD